RENRKPSFAPRTKEGSSSAVPPRLARACPPRRGRKNPAASLITERAPCRFITVRSGDGFRAASRRHLPACGCCSLSGKPSVLVSVIAFIPRCVRLFNPLCLRDGGVSRGVPAAWLVKDLGYFFFGRGT